jgi:hypothetical protein
MWRLAFFVVLFAWMILVFVFCGAMCGCAQPSLAPATETWVQPNLPPEDLGLPMSHLKVETETVEPSVLGEVEM